MGDATRHRLKDVDGSVEVCLNLIHWRRQKFFLTFSFELYKRARSKKSSSNTLTCFVLFNWKIFVCSQPSPKGQSDFFSLKIPCFKRFFNSLCKSSLVLKIGQTVVKIIFKFYCELHQPIFFVLNFLNKKHLFHFSVSE